MKYVIVYAHPNPKSFNHAILERVEGILRAAGNGCDVRDLYALGFNPVLEASGLSLSHGAKAPSDVEREQRAIGAADAVVFIYPVWWWGMPAILRGYIDRVFTLGFAYAIDGERLVGLFAGKKAFIINTLGSSRELVAHAGYEEAMRKTTDLGILGFCGMKVVEHRCLYAVHSMDDSARGRMLDDLATIDF
jgi:NAD(P)H dehydrogenase (quinone)